VNQDTTEQATAVPLTPQQLAVQDAMAVARAKHSDFQVLEPVMLIIAKALTPNWQVLTPAEYISILYLIAREWEAAHDVRNAVFAQALEAAQPDQAGRVM
jgi:hypothetical protein